MWPAIIVVAIVVGLWVGFRLWLRSKRQQFFRFALETRARQIEEAGGEEAWGRTMQERTRRALGRTDPAFKDDAAASEDDALNAYATLLATSSIYLQCDSSLPLPKAQLKVALIREAQEAARCGMDDYVPTLRRAYCHLSTFVDEEIFIRNLGRNPFEMREEDQRLVGDEMDKLGREFDNRVGETPRGQE